MYTEPLDIELWFEPQTKVDVLWGAVQQESKYERLNQTTKAYPMFEFSSTGLQVSNTTEFQDAMFSAIEHGDITIFHKLFSYVYKRTNLRSRHEYWCPVIFFGAMFDTKRRKKFPEVVSRWNRETFQEFFIRYELEMNRELDNPLHKKLLEPFPRDKICLTGQMAQAGIPGGPDGSRRLGVDSIFYCTNQAPFMHLFMLPYAAAWYPLDKHRLISMEQCFKLGERLKELIANKSFESPSMLVLKCVTLQYLLAYEKVSMPFVQVMHYRFHCPLEKEEELHELQDK